MVMLKDYATDHFAPPVRSLDGTNREVYRNLGLGSIHLNGSEGAPFCEPLCAVNGNVLTPGVIKTSALCVH